ncbi:hypothetical protein J2Z23_000708 [Lederbergia galactosidilyticus]|uniref:hypothetical protein n=1 Tax=Lederbergia galactosidilytica TaxID=217031 RepID=UPI001AE7B329|nr:hypothetical protein [Lederbergia galactosidilytica]MBP1913771.1 hypothetical protein [Lederbergia galactosidilytica]
MDEISRSTRESIVKEEIKQLYKQGFITEEEFHRFMQTYHQYRMQRIKEIAQQLREQEGPDVIQESQPADSSNELIESPAIKTEQAISLTQKSVEETKAKQAKPKKSPEQIRERNITWLLVVGVVFLLISGLVVATTSWDQMGALMKVLTLLGVSLFFLGLSIISSKFLKIDKTAFAFLALGSLLLPIGILAIGYFGLFGSYLTIGGEGRYVLGMMCTLIPLPLYMRNAMADRSRLFVWIFFLFLSFFVGFMFAAIQVPRDLFYLLIMIYNAGLLYVYHRYHRQQQPKILLFLKELPAYAQLNMIVSTLLMLVIFEQELFYSFNVLLTAVLYMAMVFVYNTKAYQFVFIALFAYGVFQFTEYSWLQSIDVFVYALLGAGYLAFAYIMRKDTFIEKVFHYTAGIISFFAFIYISFQGLMIRAGSDSWTMLLAYFVIAGTYIYLSNITNRQVFRWLAPVFLVSIGTQLWNVAIEPYFIISWYFFLFIYAALLFFMIGYRRLGKYIQAIGISTYYVSAGVMLFSLLYGLLLEEFIELAVMLVLLGVLCLLVSTSSKVIEKQVAEWLHAISWILALFLIYPELVEHLPAYQERLDIPFHVAVSSIVLLAVCKIWDRMNRPGLAQAAFYIGQVGYNIAVLLAVFYYFNDGQLIQSLIFFIGIGLAYWLIQRSHLQQLWSLVSVLTLFFYMSLYHFFPIDSMEGYAWYMIFAPVLLLVVDWYGGKYIKELKPYYFWLAHITLIGIMLFFCIDSIFNHSIHPVILFIALAIYLYSAFVKKKEWQIKLLLFAAMSMIPWLIMMHILYYNIISQLPIEYAAIIASILFFSVWWFAPSVWKKRMEWYMIPFIHVNLLITVTTLSIETVVTIIILIGWMVLSLYLLHVRKWLLFSLVPVTASIIMWIRQEWITETDHLMVVSVLFFIILIAAGRFLFTSLYTEVENKVTKVDWYTVGALFYVAFAFSLSLAVDNVWLRVIPFLMIACWLYLQINRLEKGIEKKIYITLSGISLLPAYYLVLSEYLDLVTPLLHAELRALPILILAILLATRTWKDKKQVMNHVQTVILVIITVYLIHDAIQSNTIWDALIIGTLSLAAFLLGMKFQIKSYFFVGLGTLLFNVMYQTRPYWGNMPWWGYLLIVGLLLITIASYNEWQKQRKSEGKLGRFMKKIIARLKEWN